MFVWLEQENAATAAQALADAVAAALQAALNEKGHAVLAVSGGRSPIAFFEALSKKDLNWQNVGITLVDERIVPTTHADSNTGLVREYLLKNNAAVATWIPVVEDGKSETELQPEVVVAYALKHYKQPDVLVLGMGSDGQLLTTILRLGRNEGIRRRCSLKRLNYRPQSMKPMTRH